MQTGDRPLDHDPGRAINASTERRWAALLSALKSVRGMAVVVEPRHVATVAVFARSLKVERTPRSRERRFGLGDLNGLRVGLPFPLRSPFEYIESRRSPTGESRPGVEGGAFRGATTTGIHPKRTAVLQPHA